MWRGTHSSGQRDSKWWVWVQGIWRNIASTVMTLEEWGTNQNMLSCFFDCVFWFADPNEPDFSTMWHTNLLESQYWGSCSGCTKTSKCNPSCKEGWQNSFLGLLSPNPAIIANVLLWWRFRLFFWKAWQGIVLDSQKNSTKYSENTNKVQKKSPCATLLRLRLTCFGPGVTFLVVVCRFYSVPSVRYPRVSCWRSGKATCFTKSGTKSNGPKANITQT